MRWRIASVVLMVAVGIGRGSTQTGGGMAAPGSVLLTSTHPATCVPVDSKELELKKGRRGFGLEIEVLRIKNPASTPFSIGLSLDQKAQPGREALSIPIGNLGVYPVDQPGRYHVDADAALLRLRAAGLGASEFCVRLELRRLHPQDKLSELEVGVAQPRWESAP